MILSENTTLTGNGIGNLTDAVSAIVTHEINGQYELMMTYPVTGIHYSELAQNRIIWAEPDNMTAQQAFRIYRITRPLNGIVTVYARHIAYDMSGIIAEPYTSSSLQTALSGLASHCVPSCPFTFTTARAVASPFKVSQPTALWSLLGGQQGSFLDVYGGEWAFDNYAATLTSHLGADRGVSVRYGKNMTELEQDLTIEATYVGIYPFWYDEETDTLVNLPEKYISTTGTGSRILILDCSSDFETQPTVAQLRTKANTYITANNIGEPQISWKVSFAQLAQDPQYASIAALEQVQLGDTIKVYYEPMELEASSRAVKIEYDVLMQRYKSVTLGRVKQNLAAIVAGTSGEIQKAVSAARTALDRAIENSTDFIKNGTGYMRFIYNSSGDLMEIVSLDNPDINLAQKVWRWNNGGFGFSSTGYNGTYTTAITQDGSIVADFITTGTLNAARIKAGILEDEAGKFSLNMVTGELHIEQLDVVAEKLSNIGGRNYAWAVSEEYHPDLFRVQNCTYTYNPENNGEYVVTSGATNAYQQIALYGDNGYLLPDELKGAKVIFHADYIGATGQSNPLPIANVRGLDANNTQIWSQSLTPSAPSLTFTIPATTVKIWVLLRVRDSTTRYSGETMTVRGLKLEKGEVATDWSPAPEDDTDAISSLSGKVDIQAGKVALVVEEKNGVNVIKTASIVTAINDDDSSVTINGNRINLEGAVTISSLDDATQAALITGTTTKMQYYLSTSASSATGGTWYDSPNSLTWSSGKYVWTRVATTKTYASGTSTTTYSTAVYDKQLTTALSTASTAKSTADGALSSTVSCYYRSASSTAPAKPTSVVTGTSQDTDGAWTLLMPRPKKSRYYYTCEQYTKNDGTVSWSTVRSVANANYTAMWCSASDQSYIDGGAIYANSVTAEKINVSDLSAFNATIGGWSIGNNEISKEWSGSLLTHKAGISAPATPDNNTAAFYVSATVGGATTYPFRVNYDGKLIATSAEIEGTIVSNNATITGGNITFSSQSLNDSQIILSSIYNAKAELAADRFRIVDTKNNKTMASLEAMFAGGSQASDADGLRAWLSLGSDAGNRVSLFPYNLNFFDSSNVNTVSLSATTQELVLTDGTSSGSLSKTLISLTNGTKTYSFGTTNGLFMYAGSNKYSALIWPDSNGAGRLVLGDGTSTKWRTELTNDGLVFRNASDAVMAQYPAGRTDHIKVNDTGTAVSVSSTTSTLTNLCSLDLPVGVWILFAYINFQTNATGYRYGNISTTSGSSTAITWSAFSQMLPVTGTTTILTFSTYFNTSGATLYLNARQNSGSTLSCTGRIQAIRIA